MLRWFVIASCAISGPILLFSYESPWLGLALISMALLLIYGHFRHGPIVWALLALRQNNMAKAQSLVQSIKRPQWLSKRYKGYYFFISGLTELQQGSEMQGTARTEKLDQAIRCFNACLELNSQSKHEKAVVLLNLSHIYLSRGQRDKVKALRQDLEQLELNDLQIKAQIEELDKHLN